MLSGSAQANILPAKVTAVVNSRILTGDVYKRQIEREISEDQSLTTCRITNKQVNEGPKPPVVETVSVTANKVWEDAGYANRPQTVKLQLYRDGEAYGDAVTVSQDQGWRYVWNGLGTVSYTHLDVYKRQVNDPSDHQDERVEKEKAPHRDLLYLYGVQYGRLPDSDRRSALSLIHIFASSSTIIWPSVTCSRVRPTPNSFAIRIAVKISFA